MSECPMCDIELQSGLKTCPSCGHNLADVQTEKKNQNQQILLALAILIIILLIFAFYLVDFQVLGL